jgi:hypothetical protein
MAEKKAAAPKADKRIDAIIKVLRENGISLDHHSELK